MASGGELATVLRAGIGADRVVMTGPGKREDELRAAVAAGVRAVTVESPGELARLEAIARDAGRVQPVMLRAAVSEHARLERVRLVGDDGAGKFGMDAADLVAAAGRAVESPNLDLLGLHAFGASNVLDASALVEHVAATVAAGPAAGDARRDPSAAHRCRRRARDRLRAARGVARPRRARSRAVGHRRGLVVGPDPRRRAAAAGTGPVPRRPGRGVPGSRHRPQDRGRVGRRHPRRRRPSRAAARARRAGAPDPGLRWERRGADGAGHGRRAAVLRARRLQPGSGHGAARGRRSGRRPRRRRLRLHRVDAVLPVPSDPGRGGDPGRSGGADPAAAGPRGVARPAGAPRLVAPCDFRRCVRAPCPERRGRWLVATDTGSVRETHRDVREATHRAVDAGLAGRSLAGRRWPRVSARARPRGRAQPRCGGDDRLLRAGDDPGRQDRDRDRRGHRLLRPAPARPWSTPRPLAGRGGLRRRVHGVARAGLTAAAGTCRAGREATGSAGSHSDFFIVPSTASLPSTSTVEGDRSKYGSNPEKEHRRHAPRRH